MNWLIKLDGYKTYCFTALTAIFVIIEFLIKGDFSLLALWGLAHNASILAIVACVRHAIQKATPAKVASIIVLALLLMGGRSYADDTTTPVISVSQAVQSVNIPGIILQLEPKAVNVGYFYNWKDSKIQMTYSYAPVAYNLSWGTIDLDVGYASPNVLVAGPGLVLNVPVIEKKWGLTRYVPTSIQNILNTMSIGLTPRVGLEGIGGRNRFTGGPGAYVKVTW